MVSFDFVFRHNVPCAVETAALNRGRQSIIFSYFFHETTPIVTGVKIILEAEAASARRLKSEKTHV
jgi:hypothetical protein